MSIVNNCARWPLWHSTHKDDTAGSAREKLAMLLFVTFLDSESEAVLSGSGILHSFHTHNQHRSHVQRLDGRS